MSRQTLRSRRQAQTPASSEKTARRVVFLVVVVVVVAVVVFAIVQLTRPQPGATDPTPTPPPPNTIGATDPGVPETGDALVRGDSHRLNDLADPEAVFVEFLDFECGSCAVAFPDVERLSQQYGDRVSFVIRYFPGPSHFNGARAAQAVEAAAQQGQFLAMAARIYENQSAWADRQTPMDDAFRSYAQGLGLDMTRWDAAYNDIATAERVQRDYDDGISLGVQGTPTFFLNGNQIQPMNYDDMVWMVEEVLPG